MHAGGAGLDHRAHQLVRVEVAAKAGLGVGDDWRKPVHVGLAGAVLDLVGALEGVVDALDDLGHGVGGVERLVGVRLQRRVGVGGDLPAGQVDGLEAGLHLLHGLVAGERAERVHVVLAVQQLPQALGAEARERVLDLDAAAQLVDVLLGVDLLFF